MTDITEIKRMLAERALPVAEKLLSGGKLVGHEFEAGDTDGGPGKSLRVNTRTGLWSDFATGEGGDLIDLWMACRRMTVVEVLDEARAYLGIEQPKFTRSKREWKRPSKPRCTATQFMSQVSQYLTDVRMIPLDVIEAYKVAEDGSDIIFPFMRGDELIMAKRRPAVDGGKPKPTEADCEKILFGWQALPVNATSVTICEGEIDALSLAAYGIPAMSVPYGGGGGNKQDWIENEYDALQRFETICLAMDGDAEGEAATVEIVKRLGAHRCRVVTLPEKDANACLVAGVPAEVIRQCVMDAESLDPEQLKRPSEYADKVVELMHPTENSYLGQTLPFSKTSGKIHFRDGELSLWSGESGSGKSQLLGQSICHWVSRGARVLLVSLEMAPAQTLRRMAKQAAGAKQPSEPVIRHTLDWLEEGLLIYDHVGKMNIPAMLDAFEYARARYGVTTFVIDSLMRLGVKADDYVGQEELVFQLVDWAILKDVHIHLVAHTRKRGQGHAGAPQQDDVKGAAELVQNSFNVLLIYRNRKREDALDNPDTAPEEREEILSHAGVRLSVVKQRNGDWEGKQSLWFCQDTYQYRDTVEPPLHTPYYVRLPQAAE
jgi:twinkle protein|tara:strand:+ start:1566 stop:3371 length:1806 start_codon:yes stop_codon:yes gene_type:complete